MYAYVPIWAKSTSRGEVEGPNGGLRTRCGLSSFTLCSFRVLLTYLWWVDIKCSEFALTGRCDLRKRCPYAHEKLSDGERDMSDGVALDAEERLPGAFARRA